MPRALKLEHILEQVTNEALEILGISGVSIDIYLVSDDVIHNLNKTWRGKDKPTNVLSFEYSKEMINPENDLNYLGEVYLAPEYMKLHNEDIRRILIHGVLHLLGYDHIKKEDAKIMEKLEKDIFSKMGI